MTTRYVTLGPLLSGEGSRAFMGLQITDGAASPCALVWVPEQVLCEPELVERLRRDTAHAERLRHPNIARVFGLIEVDEGLARVVEFADGESLRRILDVVVRLPADLAARIVVDAALAVQYAHLTGNTDGTPLVHGDLRPETLLVSYSGITKVTGYGALSVAPKEIGGNRVMGRRTHCAPEQILGGRYAVSPQTDVYLLGTMLYEAIIGEIPFQGEKDFERAVVSKEPLTLNSDLVPPKLWPVIRKAMAKKGGLRFATAQAFGEAVEQALGGLPSRSELATFLDRSFASDPARDARRRELQEGIEEWVARRGLRLASAAMSGGTQAAGVTISQPARKGSGQAEIHPAASESAASGGAPIVALRPEVSSSVDRAGVGAAAQRTGGTGILPWAIAAVMALALAGGAFWLNARGGRSKGLGESSENKAEVAGVPHESPSGPDSDRAGKSRIDKKADDNSRPKKPERAAKPAAMSTLEVSTEPQLSVYIDGKLVGRSPQKVTVPVGKHRVRLADPSLGIEIIRNTRVNPGPNQLSLKVGSGTVNVNAPAGSEVRIDGRLMGTMPLAGPLTVFEGKHRIQVSLDGAQWQQPFSITAGGGVNVDVHFEERKLP